jgi:hypothetical protein
MEGFVDGVADRVVIRYVVAKNFLDVDSQVRRDPFAVARREPVAVLDPSAPL